jgi:hypothetical protein
MMMKVRRIGDETQLNKSPNYDKSICEQLDALEWPRNPQEDENEDVIWSLTIDDKDTGLSNGVNDELSIVTTSDGTKLNLNEDDFSSNKIYSSGSITTIGDDSVYIGDNIGGDSIQIGDPVGDQYPYGISGGDIALSQTPNNTYLPGQMSFSTGVSIAYNQNEKYAVMNLPRKELPLAVYVCGRMLTLGILGTDVECAYTGEQLIFEPGAVSAIRFGSRITASVEYNDEILHYNVGQNGAVTYEGWNSSTLEVTLISTIKKEGALSGTQ